MNNKPQKFGKRNFFVETAPELPRYTMARFTLENRRATIQNIQMIEDIAPVFTAENVNSGFDVFKRNQEQIGLILSDQKMPDGTGPDGKHPTVAISASRIKLTSPASFGMPELWFWMKTIRSNSKGILEAF